MGTGDLCRVLLAAVHHGRGRQSSVTGPCGYCSRVLRVPVSGGQFSGNIRFIRNPGYNTRGAAMWVNVILTTG